jgi:TIR domain
VTQEPPRGAFSIFINYRREDTAGHAGRLYDALAGRFGDNHVFMDVDAIDPGADFTQVVEQSVGSCDVLLALIGRRWTTTTDREGRRRLDKPNDWVRVEIQTALARPDTRVIPTLVQGAEMPSSDDLPADLHKLADRNAFEIRDSSWRSDVDRLIAELHELAGGPRPAVTPQPARQRPRWLVPALVAAALLVLGTLAAVLIFSDGGSSKDPELARYVGQIDARLTSSAHSKGDLNALIGDVKDENPLPRAIAIDRIDAIIRQRRGLLDDLAFAPPKTFRDTHDLLRKSVQSSLADDIAVKHWMQGFYAGAPDRDARFAEVGRLSTIASQQKEQFLDEYNELREEKLGLTETRPAY